jgi:hypothetical protein
MTIYNKIQQNTTKLVCYISWDFVVSKIDSNGNKKIPKNPNIILYE